MEDYEINNLAHSLEKTDINSAISLYEELISKKFDGSMPYDRLIIIYKKLHKPQEAIRIAKCAVDIFTNYVHPTRADRETKLIKYQNILSSLLTGKPLNRSMESLNRDVKNNRTTIERITVIDFETASSAFFSACALGLVVLQGREIIDKQYFLIQPPDNFYEKDNVAVHGITAEQTAHADTFPVVWEKVRPLFENTYVAAHNANFDMSVLKATLEYYGIKQPSFQYMNTISVSGYTIPRNANVGKSLADRCAYFNIPLENHHNALCDAEAAAQLIIYQLQHSRYKSFATFVSCCVQLYDYDDVRLKKSSSLFGHKRIDVDELAATTAVREEQDEDFKGKTFVFTGELTRFTREQAMSKVIAGGGFVKNGVSKKIDVLVHAENDITSKVKKAMELQAEGHPIKIITEEQFMQMLESN